MKCIIKLLLLGLCFMLEVSVLIAESEKDRDQGIAVIERAQELSNIRAEGSPPFRLLGHVRVWTLEGKAVDGECLLVWFSPNRWREEVRFAGYHEVRVGGDSKTWLQGTTKFEPFQIYELNELLSFDRRLRLPSGPAVKPQRGRKRHEETDCFEVFHQQRPQRELCLDNQTGSLVREEGLFTGEVYEYSDFAAWGRRLAPKVRRALEGKKPVVEVNFQPPRSPSRVDLALLGPLPDAEELPWCENPEPAEALESPLPPYPTDARLAGRSGFVRLYANIGVDGSVQNARVLHETAGPELTAEALTTVRRWRYRPPICDGKPIPTETVIQVNFTLGP